MSPARRAHLNEAATMDATEDAKPTEKTLKTAERRLAKIVNKIKAFDLNNSRISALNVRPATCEKVQRNGLRLILCLVVMALFVVLLFAVSSDQCLVPAPYNPRAAFRPPEPCAACDGVRGVARRSRLAPADFEREFAGSLQPLIVTDAMENWTAPKVFDLEYFKKFYASGSLGKRTNDCFFFPYKSGFESLQDTLSMDEQRANLTAGTTPWYVGWNTCHDRETIEFRKHYSRPYFLPHLSESDMVDWIFMGGPGQGVHMHVDSVKHVSWQAQLRGQKRWSLAPAPECLYQCEWFTFTVNPGEILIVDTNRWYHKTIVVPGGLSITIGAEFD